MKTATPHLSPDDIRAILAEYADGARVLNITAIPIAAHGLGLEDLRAAEVHRLDADDGPRVDVFVRVYGRWALHAETSP